jgi:hypothetical protein
VTPALTFTSGSPGTLMGTYRYKPLLTPVVLTTGKYLINAWGFGDSDKNGNTNLALPPAITGHTGGGLLSYNDLAQFDPAASPGIFPTSAAGVTSNFQFAAGSFIATPEPQTYLLMGSMLVAALYFARRKQRNRA